MPKLKTAKRSRPISDLPKRTAPLSQTQGPTAVSEIKLTKLSHQEPKSEIHKLLMQQIEQAGLPQPIIEAKFCDRQFRLDMAWPFNHRLYVEIDGGSWGRIVECNHCNEKVFRISKRTGRVVYVREGLSHTSGAQYEKNAEKGNLAAELGWRGLHFTTNMVRDGRAIEILKRVLAPAEARPPVVMQGELFGTAPKKESLSAPAPDPRGPEPVGGYYTADELFAED